MLKVSNLGFWVQGLRLRVLRVLGLEGLRASRFYVGVYELIIFGVMVRVLGLGFQGLGFQGLGFRVSGLGLKRFRVNSTGLDGFRFHEGVGITVVVAGLLRPFPKGPCTQTVYTLAPKYLYRDYLKAKVQSIYCLGT